MAFGTDEALQYYNREVHGGRSGLLSTAVGSTHGCGTCALFFTTRDSLDRHLYESRHSRAAVPTLDSRAVPPLVPADQPFVVRHFDLDAGREDPMARLLLLAEANAARVDALAASAASLATTLDTLVARVGAIEATLDLAPPPEGAGYREAAAHFDPVAEAQQ